MRSTLRRSLYLIVSVYLGAFKCRVEPKVYIQRWEYCKQCTPSISTTPTMKPMKYNDKKVYYDSAHTTD